MRLEPMQNQQVREEPQKLILQKTKIMIYGINVSNALANCYDRIYLIISINNLDKRKIYSNNSNFTENFKNQTHNLICCIRKNMVKVKPTSL